MIERFGDLGLIAWPLLACSATALTVALERGLFWLRVGSQRDRAQVVAILDLAKAGKWTEAREAALASNDAIARILRVGLTVSPADLASETEIEARAELERARRGIGVLDTIVAIAPLLGILGTVVGVVDVFDSISDGGIRNASEMEGVMRGIGKALITTAVGLTIAIPTLVVHNGLLSLVRRHVVEIERAATRLQQSVEADHEAG